MREGLRFYALGDEHPDTNVELSLVQQQRPLDVPNSDSVYRIVDCAAR